MRFKLTDQLLFVAVMALAVFLARFSVELHWRGFERSEIAIVVGVAVSLDLVSSWAAINVWRPVKARAKSTVR
jgi:hypothetical protein